MHLLNGDIRLRSGAYRGIDRRRCGGHDGSLGDRSWIVGGVALAALLVVTNWLPTDGDLPAVRTGVRSAGLILTAVIAAAALLDRHATGRAAGLHLGIAAALMHLGLVAESIRPGGTPGWIIACAAPILLAAVWVGRAVTGPEVDTGLRPVAQARGALLAVFATWGVATASADVFAVSGRVVTIAAHVLVAGAWAYVAVAALLGAVRGTSTLRAWSGWMATAMSLAVVAYYLAYLQDEVWLLLAAALRVGGLTILAVGVMVSLSRSVLHQRDARYIEAVTHHEQRQEVQRSEQERDHEIRTALLAIEGATLTLDRHRHDLDPDDRAELGDVVRSGIEHLRELVTDTAGERRPVERVVCERIALARGRGAHVTVSIDPSATGEVESRMLRQVLDNLLTNAERHGAGDGQVDIHVEVVSDGPWLRIRVTDDGPGVPDEQAEEIFARGACYDDGGGGAGLGLHVARRLVHEQGGDLRLVPSSEGACFEVSLPRAAVGSKTADEGDDGIQVTQPLDLASLGPVDRSPALTDRPVVQYHGELGSRLRRAGRDDGNIEATVGAAPLGRRLEEQSHVGEAIEEGP